MANSIVPGKVGKIQDTREREIVEKLLFPFFIGRKDRGNFTAFQCKEDFHSFRENGNCWREKGSFCAQICRNLRGTGLHLRRCLKESGTLLPKPALAGA